MKKKLMNLGLLITFLICYVNIGHTGSQFIFQMDIFILPNLTEEGVNFSAVFILLGGQILLLIAMLFKNRSYKILTAVGLIWLTVLVLISIFISLMTSHWYSLLSTVPYLLFATLTTVTLVRRQTSVQ